jgi:hypothetical protein
MARRPADPRLVEVCFVISTEGAVVWADASASAVSLPDARSRWEAIWRHREHLGEIAHSHPVGPEAFSVEDEATMEAIDSALGRPVRYSVVAPRRMIARQGGESAIVVEEPWWAALLRQASGMKGR